MSSGVAEMLGHARFLWFTTSSVARHFGDPSAACSPAEPASVWPKVYGLAGSSPGGMRVAGLFGSVVPQGGL